MSIFISICAYNDHLLVNTLKDALNKAKYPDQLFFGLALSYDEYPDLSFIPKDQKNVLKFNPEDRPGVNHKRYLISCMFDNQDYFLQIDSHMIFCKDWDAQLIETLKKIKKYSNNEKILLSNVKDFDDIEEYEHRHDVKIDKIEIKPTFIINNFTSHLHLSPDFSKKYEKVDEFMKSYTIKSNFIFADKNFIKEVGFDPYSQIINEESFHSFLCFIKGWDVYHTPKYQFITHKVFKEDYKKIWGEKQELNNRIFGTLFFYLQDIKNKILEEHTQLFLSGTSSIYNLKDIKRSGKEWLSFFEFKKD